MPDQSSRDLRPLAPRTAASVDAYDAAASAYQEFWYERRALDAIRKFTTEAGRGSSVIDVAAGPGLDVRFLRDRGLHVVAGDLSHENMKVAKTLFPKHSLAQWDMRHLPFADGTFGGVWAPAALQHLPVVEIRSTLAEFRRVHAAGPIFLTFREGRANLEAVDEPQVGTVYASTISGEELKGLLLAAGYTEVEVETRRDPLDRPDVTWLYGWGRLRP